MIKKQIGLSKALNCSDNSNINQENSLNISDVDADFLNFISEIQKKTLIKNRKKIKKQYQAYYDSKKQNTQKKKAAIQLFFDIQQYYNRKINYSFSCLHNITDSSILNQQSDIILEQQFSLGISIITDVFNSNTKIMVKQAFHKINQQKRLDQTSDVQKLLKMYTINKNRINNLKNQKTNLLRTIQQLKIAQKQQQKKLNENKQFYQNKKMSLHDQLTKHLQNLNKMHKDNSFTCSKQQSVDSICFEMIGKSKRKHVKNEPNDKKVFRELVQKSIQLEQKIDQIRHVCQKLMHDLGSELSQLEIGLISEALKVLQLKPLG